MKKIACINIAKKAYGIQRLEEESKKYGFEFMNIHINEISTINENRNCKILVNGEEIDWNDSVLVTRNVYGGNIYKQNLYFDILSELNNRGVRILNYHSLMDFPLMGDKLLQNSFFSKNNLPHIKPTYYFTSVFEAGQVLKDKLPLLVKPRYGSMGKGIDLIEDRYSLVKFLNDEKSEEYLFQFFVENDYDLRVIATQDKILGVMKRQRRSGITNNFSTGAAIENFDLKTLPDSEFVIKECNRLCELLRADYVGIDLIVEKGTQKIFILEINRFCQYKGLEQVTGVNFAREVLKILID